MASKFINSVGFKLSTPASVNILNNWAVQLDKLKMFNHLFLKFNDLLSLIKYELWFKYNNSIILNYMIVWTGVGFTLNLLIYKNSKLKALNLYYNRLLRLKKVVKKKRKPNKGTLYEIKKLHHWGLVWVYLNIWSRKILF